MKAKKEKTKFNFLTSDLEFEIEAPEFELIELEPIELVLPWQCPEFWQEQHLNNGEEYHSKRGRSEKNLHLNAEEKVN